jgi:hypothetical protein
VPLPVQLLMCFGPPVLPYCPCRQFFFEQYQMLDEQLFSPNRAVFPAERFSYSSFSWAVASVRSKLHAPLDADPVALVPLADAVRRIRLLKH